jgi:hypothetical protein
MSITQILELTDPALDALSEPEQPFVAGIIIAVMHEGPPADAASEGIREPHYSGL